MKTIIDAISHKISNRMDPIHHRAFPPHARAQLSWALPFFNMVGSPPVLIGKGEIFKNKVYPKTTLPFPIYTFRPTITTSHKITVQNRYTNCIFRLANELPGIL